MALVKRSRSALTDLKQHPEHVKFIPRTNKRKSSTCFKVFMVSFFVSAGLYAGMETIVWKRGQGKASVPSKDILIKGPGDEFVVALPGVVKDTTPPSSDATDAKPPSFQMSSLGPHSVQVMTSSKCPTSTSAKMILRITGDALISISLEESNSDQGQNLHGTFSFPMSGDYQIDALWHGCDGENKSTTRSNGSNIYSQQIRVEDSGSVATSTKTEDSGDSSSKDEASGEWGKSLFASGVWISSKVAMKHISNDQHPTFGPYVWTGIDTLQSSSESESSMTVSDGEQSEDLSVIHQGVITDNNQAFYKFEDLSNYELVCWVGSQSAKDNRLAFLKLRPSLFKHQRPFKFHYYKASSFTHPDTEWDDDQKTKFRKCKHILVSMDELDTTPALTSNEYKTQVTTFIGHLLKAFPDETFPIWVFTTMESPWNPSHCHDDIFGSDSDEHPCNLVLKTLFHVENAFSSRVRLLDNTDVTKHQLSLVYEDVDEDSIAIARNSMLSVIALRTYVIVGKQVSLWRAANQVGREPGLWRGDVLEPNFELVPYDWDAAI